MKYDYLIVGAGLFGAVFAYEATKKGKKCLVIDKRDHIAGNIYTKETENINVHQYGAHIFHTSDRKIWDYVNSFADFNNYINSPVAVYKDELYNLPFNMNTFSKMWNIKTPSEAKAIIEKQIEELNITEPQNLEEQALSLVGTDVYEKLIKGYTEKQWGRDCKELPAFIIKRLPLRFTYDNNYFNDRYQGIPIGGYTKIVEKMLEGSDVLLDTDYFEFIKDNEGIADKVLFTGMIDEYYDFCYGHLEYRTVRFETEVIDCDNYQGNAVVNYTDREVPYTRIIEHKHFEFGKQEKTIISREYSTEWEPGMEPYYPVNNERNNDLFEKYKALADKEEKVIFGGRLGNYKYYDMDKVIIAALEAVESMYDKLISIIVPVYNAENTIGTCVDSLVRQSHKLLEIILVDDGSTDNSGKICDELAIKDNRIKVIHKDNEGVSVARNTGINKAAGYAITFVDADDTLDINAVSLMLNKMLNNDCDIVMCDYSIIYSDHMENMYIGKMISALIKRAYRNFLMMH